MATNDISCDSDAFSLHEGDTDAHVHEKGSFFGCYLLVSRNPKCKGRTYIGYTVNPNRRIQQHNKGKQAGGAWRTSGRGPWDMVLIVHGFPNDISALRFEWAWQHPDKSRRLEVPRKKKGESSFAFRFRVLSNMLRTGPWNRLPLTIRWLIQDYMEDFPPTQQPPCHMAIAYGPIDLHKSKKNFEEEVTSKGPSPVTDQQCCDVCYHILEAEDARVECYHKDCRMSAHILCLAKVFCEDGMLVPVEGKCVSCQRGLLWGELIRRYKSREKPK